MSVVLKEMTEHFISLRVSCTLLVGMGLENDPGMPQYEEHYWLQLMSIAVSATFPRKSECNSLGSIASQ